MKLDILVFGAHPDDVELGCGGTIIKEIQNGKKVGVIDLTRGELGTRGSVNSRNNESVKASKIMGLCLRENMDFKDGFFKDDHNHKLSLIKKISGVCPGTNFLIKSSKITSTIISSNNFDLRESLFVIYILY